MVNRETIFAKLQSVNLELNDLGVRSLAVFGSIARGDYTEDSDLDILIDFSRPVGLFEFIRLKHFLEQITSCQVDLVTLDALRPEMKMQILQEAVHVR